MIPIEDYERMRWAFRIALGVAMLLLGYLIGEIRFRRKIVRLKDETITNMRETIELKADTIRMQDEHLRLLRGHIRGEIKP
jgi:hypothetical protein